MNNVLGLQAGRLGSSADVPLAMAILALGNSVVAPPAQVASPFCGVTDAMKKNRLAYVSHGSHRSQERWLHGHVLE